MTTRRVRLQIQGTVQGVFFRESTRREAERLAVSGWVRNLDDGSVEELVEGRPEQVEALVQWCHRGPPAARVERVEITEEAPGAAPLGAFRVER